MKALLLSIVIAITLATQTQGQEDHSYRFEATGHGHSARVLFETEPFARAQHRVTGVAQSRTHVDGRPAIGTDGTVPTVEITTMRFFFDGREIRVPRSLYA